MTGQELKAWRERLGLSQSQLAKLAPVAIGTLCDWESEAHKSQPKPYFYRVMQSIEDELKTKQG